MNFDKIQTNKPIDAMTAQIQYWIIVRGEVLIAYPPNSTKRICIAAVPNTIHKKSGECQTFVNTLS